MKSLLQKSIVGLTCLAASVASVPAEPIKVTLDPGETHQTIEGIGTCLISWGRYPAQTYTDSFAEFYFGTVGLNILRSALDGFLHPEVENPADISWGASPDFGPVQASAFHLPAANVRSVVLINTTEEEQPVAIRMGAFPKIRALAVRRTSAEEAFASQDHAQVGADRAITATLPPLSVTTFSNNPAFK